MSIQCVSFFLMVGALRLANVSVPTSIDLSLNNTLAMNITGLGCSDIEFSATNVTYSDNVAEFSVSSPTALSCWANFTVGTPHSEAILDTGQLFLGVGITTGAIVINRTRDADSCLTSHANVSHCSVSPSVASLSLSHNNIINDLIDLVLPQVEKWINSVLVDLICPTIADVVAAKMTNETFPPRTPYPTPLKGACDLRKDLLAKGFVYAMEALPVTAGLRPAAEVVAPNAMHISVLSVQSQKIEWPRFHASFPEGMQLDLDIVLPNFTCPNDNKWIVTHGLSVANLKMHGVGDVQMPVDPFLELLLTGAIEAVFNITDEPTPINFPSATLDVTSKLYVMIPLGVVLAVLAPWALIASQRNLLEKTGEKTKKYIYVRNADIILVIATVACSEVFAWAALGTGACVRVKGGLILYQFTIASTCQHLWAAGIYPLAILIPVFSCVYPHIKLIVIVLYSVVWHEPRNKWVRLIDIVGKFSYIDAFVMVAMVRGVEIPGVAQTEMMAEFYAIVFATTVSILIGNYATNRELEFPLSGGLLQGGRTSQRLSYSYAEQAVDGAAADPPIAPLQNTVKWSPWIALPSVLVIGGGSIAAWVLPTLEFSLLGVGALYAQGGSLSFSVSQLFSPTIGPSITVVAWWTLLLAPILFALTFKKCQWLAAWCAGDVFAISAFSGTLHVQTFMKDMMGRDSWVAKIYTASGSLHWPIYALTAAAVLQWGLVWWMIASPARQGGRNAKADSSATKKALMEEPD